jgi:DNA-binding transcriptional ArsR family regulator
VFRDFVFGRIPFLTPTLMIRRAILPAVGEFDERLRRGQDVEFLLRVFRQGKLAVLPEPLVRVYLETGKPLATAVEHSRQTLCEKHLVTVRRELGWYAARFFRADNLWLIAEACFREGQLLSGAKYWAQALAATPFMPLSRYVRILLAACGLLPYLKRLAARWQHVVRTPAARPGHS